VPLLPGHRSSSVTVHLRAQPKNEVTGDRRTQNALLGSRIFSILFGTPFGNPFYSIELVRCAKQLAAVPPFFSQSITMGKGATTG